MKVLIIDNYDSFTYNLVELFREVLHTTVDVVYNDQINFSTLHTYTHLVLSPGPSTPAETPNLFGILDACKITHKILGVCLGHQAIAEYFGATLIQLPKPYHGYTTSLTLNQSHILFDTLPKQFSVGLYHSWTVNPMSVPPSLIVTATSADGHIMAIRHTRYNIHGMQFHPESYMTKFGKEMIMHWLFG